MKQSRTTPRIRRLHQRFIQRIPGGWKSIIVAAVFLTTLISVLTHGRVEVEEFCPQTFQFRTHSWYEIPIIRLRVTGDQEIEVRDTQVGHMLRQRGWLAAPGTASTWYHVITIRTGNTIPGIAHDVRDLELGDGDAYIDFARGRPEMANVLWPIIVREVQKSEEAAATAMKVLFESDGSFVQLWHMVWQEDPERLRKSVEYWVDHPEGGPPRIWFER